MAYPLLLIATVILAPAIITVNGCSPSDKASLLAFKAGLSEPYLGIFKTWSGDNCCLNWYGVSCDAAAGRVSDINLRGESEDPIFEKAGRSGYMTGKISPEICKLDHLTTLVVADWKAISGEIPPCITSLSNLRILDLIGNRISGEIPADIGKLQRLTVLNLADNTISGKIPASIVNLASLKHLDSSLFFFLSFFSLSCSTNMLCCLPFFFGFAVFLGMHFPSLMADCPLDFSASNFTLASSLCSNQGDRGNCCRYINANVAISVARFANSTSILGVPPNDSVSCLQTISDKLQLNGVPQNATAFCGFGTKIPVNYECKGRTSVMQMLQSPRFAEVTKNCKVSLGEERKCRKCLNAGFGYLHHLGINDNITLSTCRDATFAALASQLDHQSTTDIASCFFGVQGLLGPPVSSSPSLPSPEASPSPVVADSPSQLLLGAPFKGNHHTYHLTLVPGIAIAVTAVAVGMLIVLIVLIRKKSRELDDPDDFGKTSSKTMPPFATWKFQEGSSTMFRKFSYKEIKKATEDFSTVIGQGGFGTVYKAHFSDGLVAAVKRMNRVSEQGEDEFCREIELLARLHHRHLVSLRGFCIKKHERFLMYEYMGNGSLKDHLHSPGRTPLSWRTRIQIAIDVANALEYLHLYCDPPLCHRDIKSSNTLLDENFVAKIADFGLAQASKNGSICFEPLNTEIRGTPGYMDPEYVVTQELTEKSDIYSFGVLLLEIVTGRRAIQDNKNLVEWAQPYMESETRLLELVDPNVRESFDLDQLHTVVSIVGWCTQREGRARPSIKQVLRLLYETSEPMHSGFLQSGDDEDCQGSQQRGRRSKGKMHRNEAIFNSGDGRYLASSSSTSRSYCSRTFLLESCSPQSPPNIFSV